MQSLLKLKKNHRLCIGLGFIQGYNIAVRCVSAGCSVMMDSHCHSTAFILPELYDYLQNVLHGQSTHEDILNQTQFIIPTLLK